MGIDSSHWYKRDGTPCYEVPRADGKGMRNVMLQHDRKLNLVPSVTTVLSIIDKPGLNKWKEDQMMLAALTLPRKPDEPDDAFCKRVRTDAFQQVVDAADEGTNIHNAIEASFANQPFDTRYAPHVAAVRAELARTFPQVLDWQSETSFAHSDGFGGKVDLHSPSTGITVDFKSKDGDFIDPRTGREQKLAYDQHWQLGGYQHGLKLPVSPGASIFLSRTHPGEVRVHVWTVDDMALGRNVFTSALALWKLLKKYDPSF